MTSEPDVLGRLERQLGWLLTLGVAISAALLALCLVVFVVVPATPWASRFLAGGLMILMATPVLRVVVSMIEYARIGEWSFVVTTLVVFAELIAGVVYALRR